MNDTNVLPPLKNKSLILTLTSKETGGWNLGFHEQRHSSPGRPLTCILNAVGLRRLGGRLRLLSAVGRLLRVLLVDLAWGGDGREAGFTRQKRDLCKAPVIPSPSTHTNQDAERVCSSLTVYEGEQGTI